MRSILFLIVLVTSSFVSISQTVEHHVISSTGTEIRNSNGELYFTVGEPASELLENEDFQLTQGYHQGLFLFVATEDVSKLPFEVKLYPNPAAEFVNITLVDISPVNFEYTLFDLNGKVQLTGSFSDLTERLSLSNLANSTYFLKIYNSKAGYDVTYQLQKSK